MKNKTIVIVLFVLLCLFIFNIVVFAGRAFNPILPIDGSYLGIEYKN